VIVGGLDDALDHLLGFLGLEEGECGAAALHLLLVFRNRVAAERLGEMVGFSKGLKT
jgi:hypothetical protein